MSCMYIHKCPTCGFEIEAWEDGNPYIRDDKGKPRFYYHPGGEEDRIKILEECRWAECKSPEELEVLLNKKSGVMSEFICMDCCKFFKTDAEKHTPWCRKCGSQNVMNITELAGVRCPKCRMGNFPSTPEFGAIS